MAKIKLPYSNRVLNTDFNINGRLDDIGADIISAIGKSLLGDENTGGYAKSSIDSFKSNIGNYVRPTQFSVLLLPPAGVDVSMDILSLIGRVCHTSTMPTQSYTTTSHTIGDHTAVQMPYDKSYGELRLLFHNVVSSHGGAVVWDFWQRWAQVVQPTNHFEYADNYFGTIIITQYDASGVALHSHRYTDVYPINVASTDLAYDQTDSIQSVSVQLAFGVWERLPKPFSEIYS